MPRNIGKWLKLLPIALTRVRAAPKGKLKLSPFAMMCAWGSFPGDGCSVSASTWGPWAGPEADLETGNTMEHEIQVGKAVAGLGHLPT